MTNERAVEILNLDLDILGQYGDKTAEAYKMAIKALEQEPCEDCISRQAVIDTIGNVPDHNDGMVFEALSHAQRDVALLPSVTPRTNLAETSQDCISRQKALDCFEQTNTRQGAKYAIETLPSVTPRINLALTSQDCISREEVQDLISRWLSDYLLDETREALETINYKVGDMPSVTPERPKGKWIEVLEHRDEFGSTWHYECSECRGRSYKGFEPLERCCPNCGAEMGGGEDEEA